MVCEWCWLGTMEYAAAWTLQERLAGDVALGVRPPMLLLLEHPHTYTLGRRANKANLLWNDEQRARMGVRVFEVDRGGDITYHGPGQLVGYPILALAPPGWLGSRLPQADFIGYVRKLEALLITTLAGFGIAAGTIAGKTGVWVSPTSDGSADGWDPSAISPGKIASIGVKIDVKGISRHGFALNIAPDRVYWDGIIPCGLEGVSMVSMADFIHPEPPTAKVAGVLALQFGSVFNATMKEISVPDLS